MTARFLSSLGSLVVIKSMRSWDLQRLLLDMMSIHIGDYEIHHSKIHADGFLTLGLPVLYVADPRTPRNLCLREWPLAGGAKTSQRVER
uniref:Uncharacterized protein n=1 Tax=Fusarium oxysporum (strain Fo5176) TaxID=660025 RepID=A0A0D2YFP9_FUSOF